jgi:2-haloacid dehalogenase
MELELDGVRALTFDVGGTVFDWHHGVRDEVNRLAATRGVEVDAARFANEWRREMFVELGQVRARDLPWLNADQLHRRALDLISPHFPALELTETDLDELNTVWHRLSAWPDFPAVLPRLRSRYTTAVLTVLSLAIVVDCSKHNDLSWDAIVSCEFLGHYKPDPEAYLGGLQLLGAAPGEAMMVAAHPGDLRAAAAAGLHTAYVPRPGERGEGNDGDLSPQPDFDLNAQDFPDLATQLDV